MYIVYCYRSCFREKLKQEKMMNPSHEFVCKKNQNNNI